MRTTWAQLLSNKPEFNFITFSMNSTDSFRNWAPNRKHFHGFLRRNDASLRCASINVLPSTNWDDLRFSDASPRRIVADGNAHETCQFYTNSPIFLDNRWNCLSIEASNCVRRNFSENKNKLRLLKMFLEIVWSFLRFRKPENESFFHLHRYYHQRQQASSLKSP